MSKYVPETGLTHPSGQEALKISAAQLGTRNLTGATAELSHGRNRIYQANEELWLDLLSERLPAATYITLERFWLSQWLPLRPGLFHTQAASMRREDARRYLLTGPQASERALAEFQSTFGRNVPRSFRGNSTAGPTYIYHPYGKGLMLEGGIGCIRLKPKALAGSEVWFMGASSEPVAHQGIPVAVPDELYSAIVDDIASSGCLQCTLKGRLKLVPPDLDPLYRDLVGVPQVYLMVETITDPRPRPSGGRFFADGAVMVLADSAGQDRGSFYGAAGGIYSAYASFDPGRKGSVNTAAAWLSDVYAGDLLGGKVLTDFDEQIHHFKGVKFSLENIMGGQISESDAKLMLRRCGVEESDDDAGRKFKERVISINGSNNILAIDGGVAAGGGSAVAYGGGVAAAGGGSAASRDTTPTSAMAGLVGRAKGSLWARISGLVFLAATVAATVLLALHITDIGIASYVVAVISIIVGVIPLLRAKDLPMLMV